MELTGEYLIPAPREAVWAALNDADVLRRALPGVETLDQVSDTEFTATVSVKVGPVKARFTGRVELGDLDPPNGYTISGEGQGGVAGFARGKAQVSLEEEDGQTRLRYSADAQVGGKLAQVGSRLIAGTARRMADAFFSAFAAEVVAQAGEAPPAEAGEAPAEAPRGIPAAIWVGGLIILALVLLWLVT